MWFVGFSVGLRGVTKGLGVLWNGKSLWVLRASL